jgi:hypothetical protein
MMRREAPVMTSSLFGRSQPAAAEDRYGRPDDVAAIAAVTSGVMGRLQLHGGDRAMRAMEARVHGYATEALATFGDPPIKAFLPALVERAVLERLRSEGAMPSGMSPTRSDERRADEAGAADTARSSG